MVDRFLQRVPRSKVKMIFRDHIPGICDHLIDQILVQYICRTGTYLSQDRLKPEQLVALCFIIEQAR